jgi:hypothetical protein
MYGQGSGVLGVSSTATGVAVLPNTGDNLALVVLSVATIAVGVVVTASFVIARVAGAINR